jgi:hypothetical protein
MNNLTITKKKKRKKKKKKKKITWKDLVNHNVERGEWQAYEMWRMLLFTTWYGKTSMGSTVPKINLDKPFLNAEIIIEYIMHHITFNWSFIKEWLVAGFKPLEETPKSKKRKKNRKKNRVRCMTVATSALYDAMWRRSTVQVKHWTFLFVNLERDPSSLYFFWSDQDEGVWFNHRLRRDPENPNSIKNYESPRRNMLNFSTRNRILEKTGIPSTLEEDFEMDARGIVGNFQNRQKTYDRRRWEDGKFYGNGPLSEFYHNPMVNVPIFDNEMKTFMKAHVLKHWKLIFMAFFKKMGCYKMQVIERVVQYRMKLAKDPKNKEYANILRQLLTTSDYFTMHFLIPVPTDDLEAFPFFDSDNPITFISMVWYTIPSVESGVDQTVFWHVSTSPETVRNDVKHTLGDYTTTPYNAVYGEENLNPEKEIYNACGYPDVEPDDIVWEYRDFKTGNLTGYGSLTKFLTDHMVKVNKVQEIDHQINSYKKALVLKEALSRPNRNPKYDKEYTMQFDEEILDLMEKQSDLETEHEEDLAHRAKIIQSLARRV